jgi:phosphatidylethanolamine/phosphatidyl-N-methylethanolamine N-methyltransferase
MSSCAKAPHRSGDPFPSQTGANSFVDALTFFGRWLRDPAAMAAIAPSGRWLADLITRAIDPRLGPVLELGSGTGAFVPAMRARGVAERDLTLVELDPALAAHLTRRYPKARVLNGDAAAIGSRLGDDRFGAVICGLGLLNMRPAEVEAILTEAFAHMAPAACFYLFTYGRACSVPDAICQRLGIRVTRVGTAWRNLPPARVFCLSRSDMR